MKRIALFLATNLAVLVVLGVVARLFGLDQWLVGGLGGAGGAAGGAAGGSLGGLGGLLAFAALFGFGGSFISLAMSKMIAKRSMGVQIIEQPRSESEHWLVETVRRQSEQAGIGMPEVGVFDSAQPNAFATGMKKNDALVAVSTGLLQHMSRDEVEAVLGHEVAHVANGDMVTMGLIQGVLNTFVIFFARIVGMLVDSMLRGGNNQRGGLGMGYFLSSMVAEMVFGILASFIAAWFSRQREFRADTGGAALAGRSKMIAALRALQRVQNPEGLPDQMAAFGILGGRGSLLQKLASTHPPLEDRIAALQSRG